MRRRQHIDHGVDGKYVGGGFCEHGNEYCVCRKVGQFIPWLICCKLTRKTVQCSQLIHILNTDIVTDSFFLTFQPVCYVPPEGRSVLGDSAVSLAEHTAQSR